MPFLTPFLATKMDFSTGGLEILLGWTKILHQVLGGLAHFFGISAILFLFRARSSGGRTCNGKFLRFCGRWAKSMGS